MVDVIGFAVEYCGGKSEDATLRTCGTGKQSGCHCMLLMHIIDKEIIQLALHIQSSERNFVSSLTDLETARSCRELSK